MKELPYYMSILPDDGFELAPSTGQFSNYFFRHHAKSHFSRNIYKNFQVILNLVFILWPLKSETWIIKILYFEFITLSFRRVIKVLAEVCAKGRYCTDHRFTQSRSRIWSLSQNWKPKRELTNFTHWYLTTARLNIYLWIY